MKLKLKELLSQALHKLHVVDADEDIDPEHLRRAAGVLKFMLASWGHDVGMIYSTRVTKFTPVELKNNYNEGEGLDFYLGDGLVDIESINYSCHDEESIYLSKSQFNQNFISRRTRPSHYIFERQDYANRLVLDFVPTCGFSLVIRSKHSFADSIDYDCYETDVELPDDFFRAIVYCLAVELAPSYNKEAMPTVQRIATASRSSIKRRLSKPITFKNLKHSKWASRKRDKHLAQYEPAPDNEAGE